MGWYSLYKWYSTWSKVKNINIIYWYSQYVLKDKKQREFERERSRKQLIQSLIAFGTAIDIMNNRI